MVAAVDLTGKVFGRLLVLGRSGSDKQGHAMWLCRCDCGSEVVTAGRYMRRGSTGSCGCLSQSYHLQEGQAGFNEVFRKKRRQAKERGYIWELTRKQVRILTSQDCYYCGTEPSQVAGYGCGEYIHNGIDRKNNKLGYIRSNCVPCCGYCNNAKGMKSVEQFKAGR